MSLECALSQRCLERILDILESAKEDLDAMDAVCGDGETGTNLMQGVQLIRREMNDIHTFVELGQTLNRAGCGSLGTLISLLLFDLDPAQPIRVNAERVRDDFLNISDARRGDKTMADVLLPWLDMVIESKDPINDIRYSTKLAEDLFDSTKDLPGKVGRSAYSGKKSIGTGDPGAYAVYLVIKAIGETIEENSE